MYPFDSSPEGRVARQLALTTPESYVLKPQREGGGNNIYRSSIPDFIKSLPDESHYNAYILMELIQPPPLTNSIIREGRVVTGGVVCELGVYEGIDGTGDGVWKLLNIMRVIGIIHIGIDHRRSWTF